MNRKYEVLLLLDHKLEKAKLDNLIKDIETKLGGNIVKKEDQGIKQLAYKIRKENQAYYVLYFVETTSENIQSLKDMIAITKDIIRPMILRHEKKWPYEYKTAKDLKFPERKPRQGGRGPNNRGPRGEGRPSPRPATDKPAAKEVKNTDSKES